jgi:ATP synthase protein I
VIAVDLPSARRLALSVALGQAVVTLIAAVVAWSVVGEEAALSAAIGGGISAIASFVMAAVAFAGRAGAGAQSAVRAFYIGEMTKIAVVIVLFTAVLKTMKVAPLAMFCTYVATFFVYWIALAGVLPSVSRTRK